MCWGRCERVALFLMIMKLQPGDWQDQLYRMNKKVYEDNGIGGTQQNGRFRKLRRFSRYKLWENIGCLLSETTSGLGGSILWEKDPNISGKNRKMYSIRQKVDLYEVCPQLFQILYYCYYFYTNTYFPSTIFVASLTIGERSLGNIGQQASSWRKTRIKMSVLVSPVSSQSTTRPL